jgi:hypothetical protein
MSSEAIFRRVSVQGERAISVLQGKFSDGRARDRLPIAPWLNETLQKTGRPSDGVQGQT